MPRMAKPSGRCDRYGAQRLVPFAADAQAAAEAAAAWAAPKKKAGSCKEACLNLLQLVRAVMA